VVVSNFYTTLETAILILLMLIAACEIFLLEQDLLGLLFHSLFQCGENSVPVFRCFSPIVIMQSKRMRKMAMAKSNHLAHHQLVSFKHTLAVSQCTRYTYKKKESLEVFLQCQAKCRCLAAK